MVMQHYHRLVTYTSAFALPLLPNVICLSNMSTNRDFYRADGVRITHDPYAPGMAEKYGTPGNTDNEGFDPYADTVGAGIYGGIVKRDDDGAVVIGRQYQNHNPRPGPVYAGGGYAPSTRMLEDVNELITLVEKYPDLAVDITTGGAQPLHMCGMLKRKQLAVKALVERGADIEALDTYGMTPLHRMASNNLAEGAKMLLEAGADVFNTGKIGETAFDIARSSAARDVLKVLDDHAAKGSDKKSTGSKANVVKISVMGSNNPDVNGVYIPKSASDIPTGFDKVCKDETGTHSKCGNNSMDNLKQIPGSHICKTIPISIGTKVTKPGGLMDQMVWEFGLHKVQVILLLEEVGDWLAVIMQVKVLLF
ncbi:hypothetical protein ACHAWO_007014 [Cyclotella atomus]|uniref:Uncharacterized protein n=1 Tax=Cyclotella atomus TaxID=382360 RepID=A0ABD3NFZ6_9STRA